MIHQYRLSHVEMKVFSIVTGNAYMKEKVKVDLNENRVVKKRLKFVEVFLHDIGDHAFIISKVIVT